MRDRYTGFSILLNLILILGLLACSVAVHASSSDVHDVRLPEGSSYHGSEHNEHEMDGIPQHVEDPEAHTREDIGHHIAHERGGAPGHIDKEEFPLAYLFYWGILILSMVVILIYFVYRYKRKHDRPLFPLAIFLILFGVSIYMIEVSPLFSGRFDPVQMKFVHGFHEGTNLVSMRFFYKFFLGIFLTFFAFLNLDHRKFKSIGKEKDKA